MLHHLKLETRNFIIKSLSCNISTAFLGNSPTRAIGKTLRCQRDVMISCEEQTVALQMTWSFPPVPLFEQRKTNNALINLDVAFRKDEERQRVPDDLISDSELMCVQRKLTGQCETIVTVRQI